jgi:hypothetical protein
MIKGKVFYRGAVNYLRRAEKQSRFATAAALTKTAWQVKDAEVDALVKYLDRPTPFTKRAFRVQRATKQRMMAMVYAAPIQDEYLSTQVFGGQTKGHVPGKRQKLNAYGNLPRRATKRKNTFSATINGVSGVWQRVGRGKNKKIVLVAHFPNTRRYKARLPFYRIARSMVVKRFPGNFDRSFRKAMRTAR